MLIVIRKKHLRIVGFCCLLALGLLAVLNEGRQTALVASGNTAFPEQQPVVIVLDAGHGGEDGGAVASDGTVESGINLAITLRLNDLLRFCGAQTVMVRTTDCSVYSGEQKTLHEKKVSDLKNRAALVNSTKDAVLVSIHQNCLPASPRVHGAQVFYNTVDGAKILAGNIQAALNQSINIENGKTAKKIASTIYLMKNVNTPAALVECGFLSNPTETAALQEPAYQLKLATAIASGILQPTDQEVQP